MEYLVLLVVYFPIAFIIVKLYFDIKNDSEN